MEIAQRHWEMAGVSDKVSSRCQYGIQGSSVDTQSGREFTPGRLLV
jgi:hypothetical protein